MTVASTALGAVVLTTGTGVAQAAPNRLGYDPAFKGSLYNIAEVVGAHDAYAAGITGKGVGVALIDTGVARVPGLDSGNVVDGPDLSFDSQDPALAHADGFGHGTHLASIIAGRDKAGTPASYDDPDSFNGIAPDARLVDVRVGAGNGAVDVTQVIAGIDWVVEHAKDNGNNIRVINLSYGTDGVQDSAVDPLAFAVENAWKHGIVVVVSGGNEGESTQQLANPASDPNVIAVGAMDSAGTADTADDTVPEWSTKGTAARHVDVVAPGVSVTGLRVPDGYADSRNPQARVGKRFARASGTSQAAAVVSGEAALLLQANPTLTPDQVKGILTGSATGIRRSTANLAGSGKADIRTSLDRLAKGALAQLRLPANRYGSGTGSLEAARGNSHVVSGDDVLSGEVDIFGQDWNGAKWARDDAAKNVWKDGTWRGELMTGGKWAQGSWPTTTWAMDDWSAKTWRADDWSAKTWMGSEWSAKTWRSDAWSAKTWRGEDWS
jgi:serine protease AprX